MVAIKDVSKVATLKELIKDVSPQVLVRLAVENHVWAHSRRVITEGVSVDPHCVLTSGSDNREHHAGSTDAGMQAPATAGYSTDASPQTFPAA
jgi:hypothetical protein